MSGENRSIKQRLAATVYTLRNAAPVSPRIMHPRGRRTSIASSIASPIMSPVISMRSFCFSNSMSTFCMLGRLRRRFITRIACLSVVVD